MYCALYSWPSGKGRWRVEEAGHGGGGGVCVMPLAAQSLLLSATLSAGTLSPSLLLSSSVSLHTPTALPLPPSFSCSLHAFPSL